jgi:hypothetical protein
MSTFTSDSRGGLWNRSNYTIDALSTLTTDSFDYSELKSVDYSISIYGNSLFKSLYLRANVKGGDVVDSIYGKIGDTINIAVNVKKVLNSYILEFVNNENFELDIRVSRLKH